MEQGIWSEETVFDAFGGFLLNAGFTYRGDVAAEPYHHGGDYTMNRAYLFTHRRMRICPVYAARDGDTNVFLADPAQPGEALNKGIWVPYRARVHPTYMRDGEALNAYVSYVLDMAPDDRVRHMADEVRANLDFFFQNLPIGSEDIACRSI